MTASTANRALHPCPPTDAVAGLCVLASGSRGNCSLLVVPDGGTRRVILIDAGLSPRRTRRLLAERGIDLWEIDAILLTHLDADHAHTGWPNARGVRAAIHMHAAHRGRAERIGLPRERLKIFRDDFDLTPRISIRPELLHHDAFGVVAFRIRIDCPRTARCATLAYATDVGRPSPELVRHIQHADVLALESNYCPRMQMDSGRPVYLKRRIMGGSGHLSNQQCADVVRQARPRDELVCLHLSRDCNTPELVRAMHDGAAYRLTLTNQFQPTDWIWLLPREQQSAAPEVTTLVPDLPLWSHGATA